MGLPAFKRISTTFAIDKYKYYGMGIASPAALYLIVTQAHYDLATGLGGAIGGLIAGAIGAASAQGRQAAHTCVVGDLDARIRSHPEWPYGRRSRDEKREVFVVPRDAVDVLEHPSFTNLLKLHVGSTGVRIEYLLLRGASVRDYLVAAGWPLMWRGEMLLRRAGRGE